MSKDKYANTDITSNLPEDRSGPAGMATCVSKVGRITHLSPLFLSIFFFFSLSSRQKFKNLDFGMENILNPRSLIGMYC